MSFVFILRIRAGKSPTIIWLIKIVTVQILTRRQLTKPSWGNIYYSIWSYKKEIFSSSQSLIMEQDNFNWEGVNYFVVLVSKTITSKPYNFRKTNNKQIVHTSGLRIRSISKNISSMEHLCSWWAPERTENNPSACTIS